MKIKDKDKQAVKSRAAAEVQSQRTGCLAYGDVTLTATDLATLRNGDWLTDNAIAFWEELIEREQLRGPDAEHIVLLRPSMSYMVLRTTDTSSLHDVLPSFKNTTHIFVVVNDNENVDEASGGAHWSLLVVNVADKRAYHYDSYNCANEHEAQALTKKVGRLLFRDLKFVRVGSCPQQANESDCGVYVCMLMELLVQRLIGRDASHLVSMELANVSLDAGLARQQMLGRIEEVATPLALS